MGELRNGPKERYFLYVVTPAEPSSRSKFAMICFFASILSMFSILLWWLLTSSYSHTKLCAILAPLFLNSIIKLFKDKCGNIYIYAIWMFGLIVMNYEEHYFVMFANNVAIGSNVFWLCRVNQRFFAHLQNPAPWRMDPPLEMRATFVFCYTYRQENKPTLLCGSRCADCWSDGARIRNTEYDDVEGLVGDRRG